ncbi:hypothetical protein THIX_60004 [Thiomonas sp. X19]|nr:hypothetical protein THIX_60004 [Thiomonas sp. X19]
MRGKPARCADRTQLLIRHRSGARRCGSRSPRHDRRTQDQRDESRAETHAEYQRIQCVLIRAPLGSTAAQIAPLLGWSTATVHGSHSRSAQEGDAIFELSVQQFDDRRCLFNIMPICSETGRPRQPGRSFRGDCRYLAAVRGLGACRGAAHGAH